MRFRFPGNINSGSSPKRKVLWLPLVLIALFVCFQYFSAETFVNPETGQTAKVALSLDQEAAIGFQSFQDVLAQSKTIQSGAQLDLVQKVAKRLIPVLDLDSQKFEWEISLVDNDQVNAFCLPGGKIVVYTGILAVTQDADGLATVMGHEIAHATSRHGSQRMLQQGLLQTAMMGANLSLSELDAQQRQVVLAALGAGVQYGLILPYGRDHELEADEIGLRYMHRAGFDARKAVDFWQRMGEATGGQTPEFLSTHPAHGSRIERIKELLPSVLAE